MASADTIQASFRRFAGKEQFQRFVRALNRAPLDATHLRYWQECLWSSFLEQCPGCPQSYAEITALFDICEVHECKLVLDAVFAPRSQMMRCRTESPDSGLHSGTIDNGRYPYPGWGVSRDDYRPEDLKLVEVLYCPECRRLRASVEAAPQADIGPSRTS